MRRYILLSCVFLLAACAGDPGWRHPTLPKERWDADYAACRRYANREVTPTPEVVIPGDRMGNPMRAVDQYSDRKQYDAVVARCMQDYGYHKVR